MLLGNIQLCEKSDCEKSDLAEIKFYMLSA